MTNTRLRTLALFDLDNTLTDSVALWARSAGIMVGMLGASLNKSEEDVFALLRQAPSQYRFSDIATSFGWLDENGLLPVTTTAQERYERDVLKIAIRCQWQKAERNLTALYDGAFDLLGGLKSKGTSVAIFTDAEAAVMMRRLWMLGYNASRKAPERSPHDFLDLIDHVYCRPSLTDDSVFLRDCDHSFILKLKQKTTLWKDGESKPSPKHAGLICRDFATLPARTIMVGDSDKDGGCARPLGMDFLWYEPGTRHDEETVATVRKISDPGWNFSTESIRAGFNRECSPTHTLQCLSDALGFFDFAQGNPFRASPDDDGLAHRLDPAATQTPRPVMGPATHLNP